MIWPVLLSGLTLGAIGSLHCIGMCGPLSLALPMGHLTKGAKLFSLLAYQFGRIIIYSFFGLILGIAGRKIYIAGYQQWFSIILGIIISLLAILYFMQRHSRAVNLFGGRLPIAKLVGYFFKNAKGPLGFLLFGMANGLLPCGMVYIALLTTLSFTEIGESVGFMAMFGAGTLPLMMLAAYAMQRLKWKNRVAVRQMIPYFIGILGILLILRGMNLGIPFISPAFPELPGRPVTCHPGL
jgi:sulfite exporter TauE/SafE